MSRIARDFIIKIFRNLPRKENTRDKVIEINRRSDDLQINYIIRYARMTNLLTKKFINRAKFHFFVFSYLREERTKQIDFV